MRYFGLAAVLGLAAALLLMAPPANDARPAQAQAGAAEGAVGALGGEILKQVFNAVKSGSEANVYAKAKTDGPDSDDRAVKADADVNDNWFVNEDLDAKAEVTGRNDVDDGEEKPYTPGEAHTAQIEIHFRYSGDQWEANPKVKVGNKDQEFKGHVAARPDDDPTEVNQVTEAAAAAAFSVDGKTVDFCYTAAANQGQFSNVKKVDCSPLPELTLEQAGIYLASVDRFVFQDLGGDQVLVQPLVGPTIDLFHSYLVEGNDLSMFPVLRGHDVIIKELKTDAYAARVAVPGPAWTLSQDPTQLADLTIVGAGLNLDDLQVARGGRSDAELLEEYFASTAVTIVAPEHAQEDYSPQVTFRQQVLSGQDITSFFGRDFVIPVNGDPNAPVEEDPLVGVVFGVEGGIDAAVSLAVNTDGHFVRDIANAAWDGSSPAIAFTVPELNFHHEEPSALSDIALASPVPIGGTTELLVNDSAAPSESAGSTGYLTLPIAASAAGVLIALAGGGLYLRRRLVR